MPEILYALDDSEVADIETFARNNKLHNIQRLCAELRELRKQYLALSERIGRMASSNPSRSWPRIEVSDAPPKP